MSEKRTGNARTAREIRGRITLLRKSVAYHDIADDLEATLGAAEHGRLALNRILVYADDPEIVRSWTTNALAETAWLAELSPEAELSADGENEEEA